jgi:hypothetical protein
LTNELQRNVEGRSGSLVGANVPAFTWQNVGKKDKLIEDNRIPGRDTKGGFSEFEDKALASRRRRPVARRVVLV